MISTFNRVRINCFRVANVARGELNRICFWAMAKNGSSRCFLAKNECTLKKIAAESVVGRI